MPLYACEHCGFTSAAFRPEAARAHRLENPDCEGVVRIIFRSEDRYRDAAFGGLATPPAPPPIAPERQARPETPDRTFAVRETLDADQVVRLTLVGDMDLSAADVLGPRLAELKMTGRRTRLDLSQLAFIDSAGIQAVLVALADARWDGWPLASGREADQLRVTPPRRRRECERDARKPQRLLRGERGRGGGAHRALVRRHLSRSGASGRAG